MKRRRAIVLTGLLAVALLLPTTAALADDGDPPGGKGTIVWRADRVIEPGEVVEGDLVIFWGDVTVMAGGSVQGSIIVWFGNAEVEGTITGDLVVHDGDIHLGESATVRGSVVCSGDCTLQQESGARIEDGIVEGWFFDDFDTGPLPDIQVVPPPGITHLNTALGTGLRAFLYAVRAAISVLVVAAVAGLVGLIWPEQVTRVGKTVAGAWWPSLGIGALAAGGATALLITVCLSPFALLALVAAGLFGWVCLGALIGDRLLEAFNAGERAPMWAAGLGTLVISSLAALADALPCVGWLAVAVPGCAALGAVVLTKFGTSSYTPARPLPPSPPAPPAPPEIVEAVKEEKSEKPKAAGKAKAGQAAEKTEAKKAAGKKKTPAKKKKAGSGESPDDAGAA